MTDEEDIVRSGDRRDILSAGVRRASDKPVIEKNSFVSQAR